MHFQQLIKIVKQLSPLQKAKLKKELEAGVDDFDTDTKTSFTEFSLQGPVFSNEQIKTIEETRKSINQRQTK